MTADFDTDTWLAYAQLTRALIEKARGEGNMALARELAQIATEADRFALIAA